MKQKIKYWRDMRDGEDYVYTPARADGAIVDIKMITYNHEPYIRHAIESVLMQETQYPYRLFISDDHSTDRTAEIIREYQEKYPDKIATILWNYNTGLTGHGCNGIVLSRYCRAPYIATLEGDDYWTSPRKLETALAFLEAHPEYIGYAHNVRTVDENERTRHGGLLVFPVREEYIFDKNSALSRLLISQTASIVNRNYMASWAESIWDDYFRYRANGDVNRAMILGLLGSVYFSREIMSAYRLTYHGTSWNARIKGKNLALRYYRTWINVSEFVHETYGVDLPLENVGRQHYRESEEALLRRFTLENLKIYLRLRSLVDKA